MSLLTNFLNLFKYDPVADKDKTFNITQALNENWDKIDTELQSQDDALIAHKAESVQQSGGVHGLEMKTGTWTPTISSTATLPTINYTIQRGTYTKVGKLAKCTFFIRCTITGGDGSLEIAGFPFVIKQLDEAGLISNASLATTALNYNSIRNIANNTTTVRVYKDSRSTVEFSNINTGNQFDLAGTITFETN